MRTTENILLHVYMYSQMFTCVSSLRFLNAVNGFFYLGLDGVIGVTDAWMIEVHNLILYNFAFHSCWKKMFFLAGRKHSWGDKPCISPWTRAHRPAKLMHQSYIINQRLSSTNVSQCVSLSHAHNFSFTNFPKYLCKSLLEPKLNIPYFFDLDRRG